MSAALRTKDSAIMSAPQAQRPAQVVLVLLGQRRDVDRHAGQVDALVVGHRAALDDLGDDVGRRSTSTRLQRDLAVVDQQQVAGRDVAGQALVRGADPVAGRPGRPRW